MVKVNLTPLQNCFAEEYIKDLDPVQAAIRAGYSSDYARKNAYKLLCEPAIVSKIDDSATKSAEKLQLLKGFFAKKLLHILEFASQTEEQIDKNGMPTGNYKIKDVSAALKSLEILLKISSSSSSSISVKPMFESIENLDFNSV